MMKVELDVSKKAEAIRSKNKQLAEKLQSDAIESFKTYKAKVELGLSADDVTISEWQTYVQDLQTIIDSPPLDEAYQPPLPPGVTPPKIAAITAQITRVPGHLGKLGYRIVFVIDDPTYEPNNIALAVYSASECTGYLYTTGALQFDGTNYFTECPAGQEPGDNDIHFGLLYGAAPFSCFTLAAGVASAEISVYSG